MAQLAEQAVRKGHAFESRALLELAIHVGRHIPDLNADWHAMSVLAWGTHINLSSDQCENAAGAARSSNNFEGWRDQNRALWRQLIQVHQTGEAEFIAAVHDGMARKRRIELECLARIGADGLRPSPNRSRYVLSRGMERAPDAGPGRANRLL